MAEDDGGDGGGVIDFLLRHWQNLLDRPSGPLHFRLFLQPLMAVVLGIRAGRRDAVEHRTPYLWRIAWNAAERPEALRQGWAEVSRLFVFAVGMDLAAQWLVGSGPYLGEAALMAAVLALVPYAAVRGLSRRLAARLH